jgi:parvulin-like peptidyl-prolyl isomerase
MRRTDNRATELVVGATGKGGASAPPRRARVVLIGLVVSAVAAVVAVSGCGSHGETTVASVQGRPAVTHSMLEHQIAIVRARARGEGARVSLSRVREKALRFLLRADWLDGEVSAEGVQVSPRQVEQRYEAITRGGLESPLAEVLRGPGMSRAEGLLDVRIDLLEEALRASVEARAGDVNNAQVAVYYRSHRQEYLAPTSRRALMIVTRSSSEALKAKRALEDGASPAEVAARYSIDPSSRSNGGVVTYGRGEPARPWSRTVFAAKIGALTGPVAVRGLAAFFVFRVLSAADRHTESLSSVAAEIRQTLAAQRGPRAYEAFASAFEQRWRRRTSCRAGYVIAECRNYAATGPRG